jgi:cell division protein FtsB
VGSGDGAERQAQDFYVEDESGRVLVVMQDYSLELGRSASAAADVVDADIQDVQQRLQKLAERARKKGNDLAERDKAERRTLRNLYTLLCAIRAHRSGRCHVGKSLEGQQRYILERSRSFLRSGMADEVASLRLVGSESLLVEGQEVSVEGEVCLEQDPDAPRAGYRSRPTRTVLRAPPGGRLVVHTETEVEDEPAPGRRPRRGAHPARSTYWIVAGLAAAAVALPLIARACSGV